MLPAVLAVRSAVCPWQMVMVPEVAKESWMSLSKISIETEGGAVQVHPPPDRSRITVSVPSVVKSKIPSMFRMTESTPAGMVTLPGKAV